MTLTRQYTKENNMLPNNNTYKVLRNEHTTDEDNKNQIHSQNKTHNEHLRNINKIENTKH